MDLRPRSGEETREKALRMCVCVRVRVRARITEGGSQHSKG